MEEKIRLAVFGQKRLSREGGIEIVVKELCTRMAQNGCDVTCYNRAGHHVSGAEYDKTIEYDGIRQKVVPTIEKKGLAAVSSSFFAALCSAFGRYDVVHIHAEGPAFFAWLPKMFGKRVVVTVHGIDWQREKWQSGLGSKFIHQGEKNAAKYADEVIVLSKGVQDYFKETYGRETHFIPNGVNRPQIREASLITDKFGLKKGSCQCHEPSCLMPVCTKNSPSPCGNGEQKPYIIFFYLTECTSVIQRRSCFFISVSCRAFWLRFMPSLHGHALGQIARLIHVTAAQNSHIIGKQL